MTHVDDCSILIAGAGPTGLTLAIELARRGVALRLIDAAPAPFVGSRGKGLQPRTLEIFDHLGVIDDIVKSGAPYPRFRFHLGPFSIRGGSLGSRRAPTEELPYPDVWMVPQFRTEDILRTRLRALGVEVEQGIGLTGFTQDDERVRASLSNGGTCDARYLVGCDGGKSAVRKALGVPLHGQALEEKATFVGDVEVDGLARDDWHVWPFARGGVVTLCPLPSTSLFQLTGPASIEQEGVEEAVHRVSGRRVTRVAWRSTYRPHVRMVERYRAGRVFVAGDAAHVHPPAGGQGLNTGVQDAWNLGWKLAWVARGGPPSVLDTYEEERLPVAAAVLDLSRRLHVKRSLTRGALTDQLGIHYRESSLSTGGSLGTLRPGDRVPDRRLTDGHRLYDRLRDTRATELTHADGPRVLVRPDADAARIGRASTEQYAGDAVQRVDL